MNRSENWGGCISPDEDGKMRLRPVLWDGFAGEPYDMNRVLRSLSMRCHVFNERPNEVATLLQKLANNVRSLWLREQFVLYEQAAKTNRDWLGCK